MVLNALIVTYGLLATLSVTSSFIVQHSPLLLRRSRPSRLVQSRPGLALTRLALSPDDASLAVYVLSFSASHIGMSATRGALIEGCGAAAARAGLVGRPEWKLPDDFRLGDEAGNQVWPDSETAGRQLYRLGYEVDGQRGPDKEFACYSHSAMAQA